MKVPRERLKFANSAEGNSSASGFIVIELKGMDIDGVSRLVLDVDELHSMIAQGDKQEQAKRTAWELLTGE